MLHSHSAQISAVVLDSLGIGAELGPDLDVPPRGVCNQLRGARRSNVRRSVAAGKALPAQGDYRDALPDRFAYRVRAAIRPGVEADVHVLVGADEFIPVRGPFQP